MRKIIYIIFSDYKNSIFLEHNFGNQFIIKDLNKNR